MDAMVPLESVDDAERELSHTTGLIIEIDDFENQRANFHLFGVTVREPETTEVIAQIREIQHVEKNGCVTLLLQQPEVKQLSQGNMASVASTVSLPP